VRLLPIALAVMLAIAAAAASPASAAKGWKLSTVSNDLSGLHVTGSAERCGKSKFGTWKFRGRMSAEGKYSNLRWKTKITKDGNPQPLTNIRVSGTAPAEAQEAIRGTLGAQRIRYIAGSPAQLETVGSNGERWSIREFKPKRTKRC
jgi:hypothetical protein